jgi:hypothetical protein
MNSPAAVPNPRPLKAQYVTGRRPPFWNRSEHLGAMAYRSSFIYTENMLIWEILSILVVQIQTVRAGLNQHFSQGRCDGQVGSVCSLASRSELSLLTMALIVTMFTTRKTPSPCHRFTSMPLIRHAVPTFRPTTHPVLPERVAQSSLQVAVSMELTVDSHRVFRESALIALLKYISVLSLGIRAVPIPLKCTQ